MALIRQFEARPLAPKQVHEDVLCGYATKDIDGRRILQLETYGSPGRKHPGKVSQSLQLDEAGARDLKRSLERAFPGI